MLRMQDTGFPFDAFAKLLAKERICGHRLSLSKEKEGIYILDVADGLGAIAEMPGPVSWSDLEGPCETAVLWPKKTPASSVKAHRCHILMMLAQDRMAPIPRRLLLTQMVGMAARHKGVLGVYWGEGTLVHHPGVFSDTARAMTTPDEPPLHLWVDYRIVPNQDGSIGLFTTGLRPLGLMEIEVPSIDMQAGELMQWGMNLTQYQLDNGRVLKDGETIGVTEVPEFRIRYRPSRFGHIGDILAIEKREPRKA